MSVVIEINNYYFPGSTQSTFLANSQSGKSINYNLLFTCCAGIISCTVLQKVESQMQLTFASIIVEKIIVNYLILDTQASSKL